MLSSEVPTLSVDEAKRDCTLVFLDARSYTEYQTSHIKGAVWVGYEDFDVMRLHHLSRDQNLVVYCSVGYRSEKITEILIKEGFLARNLYGGIFEWRNENNSIVNEFDVSTDSVHCFNFFWGIWLQNGVKVY